MRLLEVQAGRESDRAAALLFLVEVLAWPDPPAPAPLPWHCHPPLWCRHRLAARSCPAA